MKFFVRNVELLFFLLNFCWWNEIEEKIHRFSPIDRRENKKRISVEEKQKILNRICLDLNKSIDSAWMNWTKTASLSLIFSSNVVSYLGFVEFDYGRWKSLMNWIDFFLFICKDESPNVRERINLSSWSSFFSSYLRKTSRLCITRTWEIVEKKREETERKNEPIDDQSHFL